jgi:hypothetical protein
VILDVTGLKLEDQADSDPEVCHQKDQDHVREDLQKRLTVCSYPHSQEALHHAQRVQQNNHHEGGDIADKDVTPVDCLILVIMQVVDEGPQEQVDLHNEGGWLAHKERSQASSDENDRGSPTSQVVRYLRVGRQACQNRELIEVVAREDCCPIEEDEYKRGYVR